MNELELANRRIGALLRVSQAYDALGEIALRDGLSVKPDDTDEFAKAKQAERECSELGIDTDRWVIAEESITVPQARFKEGTHPATVDGEQAEETVEQIGERLAELSNSGLPPEEIARHRLEQLSNLLERSLLCLEKGTISDWIIKLDRELFAEESETEQRLECNAMLVGILTVMLKGIDAGEVRGGGA